ncbi:MAG: glycosyltransferase family 2 protein [Dongiaceae bacterium]
MTVIALLQAKNEQRFLQGWLENVAPSVDGIVALDDGSSDATAEILRSHPKTLEVLSNPPSQPWNECRNQMALIHAGRRHGATWFLCIDADHRLEQAFAARVKDMLCEADRDNIEIYSFQLRELWGDRHHYRSDGAWNIEARFILFRNNPTHRRFDPRPFHRYWFPFEIGANIKTCGRHSELNLYHLRLIARADRQTRFERWNSIDPGAVYEHKGYDVMLDEKGLELTAIPPERDFLPRNDPAILPRDIELAASR